MRFHKDSEDEQQEEEEVLEPKKRSKRVYRKLGPRKNRTFKFRGHTFFVNTEDGVSNIYTQKARSPGMDYQVSVRPLDMMKAVRELAKIAISEGSLRAMSVDRRMDGDERKVKGN
jgi:hypothetical protein